MSKSLRFSAMIAYGGFVGNVPGKLIAATTFTKVRAVKIDPQKTDIFLDLD